jgi:hypothetical protein
MTISKSAWNEIVNKYRKHIMVKRKGDPNEAPQDVVEADGIELVCEDVAARLRMTSIRQFQDPNTGELRRITCLSFIQSLLLPVFKTLHNTPVDTYVICLDPYGMRRPEKLGTFLQRQRPAKDGVPEYLTMPPGQSRFFEDNAEMPGTLELIFNTPQAKAELYEYLTLSLQSQFFRKDIPEGKVIIFSGALTIDRGEDSSFSKDRVNLLPPLRVTSEGHTFIGTIDSNHISEGDVDVWRWVDEFKTKAFRVISNDCDVLLIGLLQMRHIIANNPARQGWFVTLRSVGSVEYSEEQVEKRETLKVLKTAAYMTTLSTTGSLDEAYRASGGFVPEIMTSTSSSSSSTVTDDPNSHGDPEMFQSSGVPRKRMRSTPDWAEHHVDMFGIFNEIIREAYHLVEKHCLPLQNPVETYVMCLCLASDKHDYIQTKRVSPGIGPHFLWQALKPNLWLIGDMVSVFRPPSTANCPHPDRIHYYAVKPKSLRTLVNCAYFLKAHDALKPSKKNNNEIKLLKARQEKAKTMFSKVSDDDIQIVAAQCAWVLQYWGNGTFPAYDIVDGLTVDENGNSLYGYDTEGWAKRVTYTNLKIAPPPPEAIFDMVPDKDEVKEESNSDSDTPLSSSSSSLL